MKAFTITIICFSLLLSSVVATYSSQHPSTVTIYGTVSNDYGFQFVSLFTDGGSSKPIRSVKIINGQYSITINLNKELSSFGNGINAVDLRFWGDINGNGLIDKNIDEPRSECHFIGIDPSNKVFIQIYKKGSYYINESEYKYDYK